MDGVLINKRYEKFDYTCRYAGVPYYYNTIDKRDVFGIGSNLKKTTGYFSHKVISGDTLDNLALYYYGNPTFWWVIAYFNDIQDPFEELITNFKTLKIPTISAIKFGDER